MYPYPLYIAKRNRTLISSAKPPKGITGAEATVSKHCMWDPFVSFRDTLKPIFDDTKKQRRPIHGIGRPFFYHCKVMRMTDPYRYRKRGAAASGWRADSVHPCICCCKKRHNRGRLSKAMTLSNSIKSTSLKFSVS